MENIVGCKQGKYMRLNVSCNEIMHYIQSYISIFT